MNMNFFFLILILICVCCVVGMIIQGTGNPLGRYVILYFFVILFYFGILFGLDSGKVLVFIFVLYIWFYFSSGKVMGFFFFFWGCLFISIFLCNFLSAKKICSLLLLYGTQKGLKLFLHWTLYYLFGIFKLWIFFFFFFQKWKF